MKQTQSNPQYADEEALRRIFKNESIFVVGQGDTINFAHPINEVITEDQLKQARRLDYVLTQMEAIVDQRGFSNHLHVWLHKIQSWEKSLY